MTGTLNCEGNILLLNLLIAMFSRRFDAIQQRSQQYWRLQHYLLYQDYLNRNFLPPPLNLLNLFSFFKNDREPDMKEEACSSSATKELEQFQERQTEKWHENALDEKGRSNYSTVTKDNESASLAVQLLQAESMRTGL